MQHQNGVRLAGALLGRRRHICAFFHSKDEEYETVLPFFKDGIDNGQKVVNVIERGFRPEHLRRLSRAGVDTAAAERQGQLQVHDWGDAYLRGGRFDQHAMLVFVEELLLTSREQGYPLTRLTANMDWALEDMPGVEDLVEYEAAVNHVLTSYDDAVVWIYDCAKFGAGVMLDILRTHPMVVIGGVLRENTFFVPPDQFLKELRERQRRSGVDWGRNTWFAKEGPVSRNKEVRLAGTVLDRSRHVCAFFNTKDEEYGALLSFIKEGFDQGDKAFHVVEDGHRPEHRRRLREAGIDVDEAERDGQLEIRRWEDAYLQEGRFDQNRMLALIEEVFIGARDQGYPLTRLVANMEWALEDRPGVNDIVEYETRLNYVLPRYDDAVV